MVDELPASPAQLATNYLAATEAAGAGRHVVGAESLVRTLTATLDALAAHDAMAGRLRPPAEGLAAAWRAAHVAHAADLTEALRQRGVHPPDRGSALSVLNRAVAGTRARLGGTGRRALRAILRIEARTLDAYADAVAEGAPPVRALLERQRAALARLANRTQDTLDDL